MVPPNWNHPLVIRASGEEGFQPMYSRSFEVAAAEWKEGFLKWETGWRPSYYTVDAENPNPEYWEYHGEPPERRYYRPWSDADATWFQVWETVSEGTPVTPPFETKAELIDYLVANGDFWDQKRRKDRERGRYIVSNCDPWTRQQAESFVNGPGWAPSMVMDSSGVRTGVEALADNG